MATDESGPIVCPLCKLLNAMAGSEAAEHVRNAHREVLLALRAVLDAHIKALGGEAAAGPAKRVKVK